MDTHNSRGPPCRPGVPLSAYHWRKVRLSEKIKTLNTRDAHRRSQQSKQRAKQMSIISWSLEDDQLLMSLKDQRGLGWKQIASHFQNRTPNACQFRWRRLKSGTLKSRRKMWSLEEDKLIMSTNLTITEISILLPQKSVNEILDRRKRLSTRNKLSISSLLNANSIIVLPPLNQASPVQQMLPPVSSIL